MRVLICGSSNWPEAKPIFDVMYSYTQHVPEESLVFISGMAPGADSAAWYLAHALGIECDEWPASKVGQRKAMDVQGTDDVGYSRNQWMLDSGVDVCHAFAYDLRKSHGTRDMVNRCVAAGVPVYWSDGTTVRQIVEEVGDHTTFTGVEVMQ